MGSVCTCVNPGTTEQKKALLLNTESKTEYATQKIAKESSQTAQNTKENSYASNDTTDANDINETKDSNEPIATIWKFCEWDEELFADDRISVQNNIVKRTGAGGGRTAFLSTTVHKGKHCWTFRIHSRRSLYTMLLGIWDANNDSGQMVRSLIGLAANQSYVFNVAKANINQYDQNNKWLEEHSYACICDAGDVISMTLDFESLTLSFTVNDTNYGKSHDIKPGTYVPAVSLLALEDAIEFIEYKITPTKVEEKKDDNINEVSCKWDADFLSDRVEMANDIVKLTSSGAVTCFLTSSVGAGKHCWSFKIRDRRAMRMLFGIWDTNYDRKECINDEIGQNEEKSYVYDASDAFPNDYVSTQIDFETLSLSFSINFGEYKKVCDIKQSTYVAAVTLLVGGDTVEFVKYENVSNCKKENDSNEKWTLTIQTIEIVLGEFQRDSFTVDDINPNDTVGVLRNKIEKTGSKYPKSLVYNNTQMNDNAKTLIEYKIKNKSVIEMVAGY